ncbi:MAG: hypothetical protein ACE5JN_14915 [Candidatus Methylomirabilia bacterium]
MALTVVDKGQTIPGRAVRTLDSGEWLAEAERYAVNLAMRWVERRG